MLNLTALICSMYLGHTKSWAVRVQVGRRLTKVSMLSGSIVRVWGALEGVLVRSESILSKSDRTMRIVRVSVGEATSLIGGPHTSRALLCCPTKHVSSALRHQ